MVSKIKTSQRSKPNPINLQIVKKLASIDTDPIDSLIVSSNSLGRLWHPYQNAFTILIIALIYRCLLGSVFSLLLYNLHLIYAPTLN